MGPVSSKDSEDTRAPPSRRPTRSVSRSVRPPTRGAMKIPPVDPMDPMSPPVYENYLKDANNQFKKRFERNACPEARVADFKCRGILGYGAFSAVYAVEHKRIPGNLALKVLDKVALLRHGLVGQVIEEKKVGWALQNKFIPRLLCAFQDSKNVYMVFKRAIYGNLSRVKDWGEPMIKRFAAQIVLAFEYLHKCDVIHRDLKTDNVLIFEDFYVQIADFGIAKRITDRTTSFTGHEHYFSPQHFRRLAYGRDYDFWLLGSLTFELTYGEAPFFKKGWTRAQMKDAVLRNKPPFPSGVDENSPINRFIRALLSKERSHRLGSLAGGILDVKQHEWFEGIDFNQTFNKVEEIKLYLEPTRAESIDIFADEIFGVPAEKEGPFKEF